MAIQISGTRDIILPEANFAHGGIEVLAGDQFLAGVLPIIVDTSVIISKTVVVAGRSPPKVRGWECFTPFSSIVQGDNVIVSLSTSSQTSTVAGIIQTITQLVRVTAKDLIPIAAVNTWFSEPNIVGSRVPFSLLSFNDGVTNTYQLILNITSPDWTNISIANFGINIDIARGI